MKIVLFWLAYLEFVWFLASSMLSIPFLLGQPFLMVMVVVMVAVTAGSNTKNE